MSAETAESYYIGRFTTLKLSATYNNFHMPGSSYRKYSLKEFNIIRYF